MPGNEPGQKAGKKLIFRASKTDPKTGETIYARDYGLRGFPIWISVSDA